MLAAQNIYNEYSEPSELRKLSDSKNTLKAK